MQCRIDPFASFVCQTADNSDNSYCDMSLAFMLAKMPDICTNGIFKSLRYEASFLLSAVTSRESFYSESKVASSRLAE